MDELVELLWDSGTVVVQGQSSRPNTSYNNFKPEIETKEKKMMMTNKDAGNPLPEILRFGSPEPILPPDFFTLPGTPPIHHHDHDCVGEGEADTDTDTVPWIDYPILDASDRCSDGELPSNLNPNPPLPPPLPPKPLDNQATVPVPVRKPGQDDASCSDKKPPHLHLQGGGLGVGLINFSHFLRPVALAKATLQSSAERLRSNEKASTSYNNSSPLQSMVIQSASASQHPAKPSWLKPFSCTRQNEVDASKHYCDDSNNKVPPPSPQPVQRIQLLEKEKQKEKDKEKDKDKDKATDKEKEKEKGMPPVVAPTSVCSRNVGPKHKLKRKSLEEDTDNATNSDEDVQDESVGLTRSSSSRGTSTKRGRTAEVHNLSERRRRDRINEKMRALQELIPNCNKVDKASMLDEAIEYLKTLQLQVQMMMMMGTGMCIPPPMMVPPGLHHMPLAPYPQMGVGMGMGMSMGMGMGMRYGMGVGDINHPSVIHTMPTPPLQPPLNFMPMINGAVFPFDNGIPPASSFRPQDEKRHVNPSNLAQSGAIGANYTDTTNGETVKSDTSSWS